MRIKLRLPFVVTAFVALAGCQESPSINVSADQSVVNARRTITVENGSSTKVGFWHSTNPDCTSQAELHPKVIRPPEHGTVDFVAGMDFARFPQNTPLEECNSKRVPGVISTYRAQRGYVGPDSFSVETFFPNGRLWRTDVSVDVR